MQILFKNNHYNRFILVSHDTEQMPFNFDISVATWIHTGVTNNWSVHLVK